MDEKVEDKKGHVADWIWGVVMVVAVLMVCLTFIRCTIIIGDTARMRNVMSFESKEAWAYTGTISSAGGDFVWTIPAIPDP